MTLTLRRTDGEDRDFRELTRLLDADLWRRYPEIQSNYSEWNGTDRTFLTVVGYVEDLPVCCGSLKPRTEGTFELKRVFARPEYRRNGLSRKVFRELEAWARERKAARIILETGIRQPEAIALYEAEGFRRIENYGEYEGDDNSVCMEKLL